ncbi:amidohydrolase [Achromobacter sp. KS-M25]|nr:amidohydrolase [Achromobacter aestuarii]
MPEGTCDCHVHIVGSLTDYPMLADRHYTPGPASVDDLRAHMGAVGATRAVIVQPSIYGSDNRCMLDAMARMNGAARGVAVVERDIDDEALSTLHEQGVRGLRINLESVGASDPHAIGQALQHWGARIAPLGWHIQIYSGLDAMAAAAANLPPLDVPIVLDHFAMIPASTSPDDPRAKAIIALVASGRAYVKLSASYRVDTDSRHADGVRKLAHAFADANDARILWASDWPHTNREPGRRATEVSAYRQIGAARLSEEVRDWFSDGHVLQALLVANPARLYGFE